MQLNGVEPVPDSLGRAWDLMLHSDGSSSGEGISSDSSCNGLILLWSCAARAAYSWLVHGGASCFVASNPPCHSDFAHPSAPRHISIT